MMAAPARSKREASAVGMGMARAFMMAAPASQRFVGVVKHTILRGSCAQWMAALLVLKHAGGAASTILSARLPVQYVWSNAASTLPKHVGCASRTVVVDSVMLPNAQPSAKVMA